MNISLLPWYCGEKLEKKLRLKNCKKVARVVFKPMIASYNAGPGTLTTEPLEHLVTAYLIITNVLIYCIVAVTMSHDVDGK